MTKKKWEKRGLSSFTALYQTWLSIYLNSLIFISLSLSAIVSYFLASYSLCFFFCFKTFPHIHLFSFSFFLLIFILLIGMLRHCERSFQVDVIIHFQPQLKVHFLSSCSLHILCSFSVPPSAQLFFCIAYYDDFFSPIARCHDLEN